jgi:hypothetical protein
VIIPTKHETLRTCTLVLGADILRTLTDGNLPLEELFQKFGPKKKLTLDRLYDAVLFLWLADLVQMDRGILTLTKNATPTAIF